MSFDLSEHFQPGTTALYLDDCRTPKPNFYLDWIIVRNYSDFTFYVKNEELPKFISFDHDLGEDVAIERINRGMSKRQARIKKRNTLSGMDAAKWLVNWCQDNELFLPLFTVHSANPTGAENILSLLNNFRTFQGQEPNGYRTIW